MRSWYRHFTELLALLWRLRPHLRGGRQLIAAVVLTATVSAALEGMGVGLLVPLLSLILGGEDATPMRPIAWLQALLPRHGPAFYVVTLCALVLGAILAKNLIFYVSQLLAARLKRRLSVNLRQALFTRLHGASLHLFEQRPAGELANTFLGEVFRTLSAVDFIVLVVQRSSVAFFYGAALVLISWQLTLMTAGLALTIGASVAFIFRQLKRGGQTLTEANRRFAAFVLESFAGVRVVRATHSQAEVRQRFDELNARQAAVEERSARYGQLLAPLAEVIGVAGGIAIIALAYFLFVRPKLMLSSHLLGFGFILLRLLPLLSQLYTLQGHLFYLAGGVRETTRWLESPQHPDQPFGSEPFAGVKTAIRLENVGFTYPNGTRALTGVSLELPAGQTVALVGPSGSGKSTVATLLLRFRAPTEGRITADGRDYWNFTAQSWHSAVAIVEQDAFLFHDTLARNIGFGFPEVTPAAIQHAVRLAHLEDVVEALPQGLETLVGERGTLLSGGQRQRLAIARALVRNPSILILDEATSALDNLSERQVQRALKEAQRGRTVLVIAHRLSTIREADQIIVLQEGRVADRGTWLELSTREGPFLEFLRAAPSLVPAEV